MKARACAAASQGSRRPVSAARGQSAQQAARQGSTRPGSAAGGQAAQQAARQGSRPFPLNV
eukprot:29075-Chlamydomonas_euryale.AAC.1